MGLEENRLDFTAKTWQLYLNVAFSELLIPVIALDYSLENIIYFHWKYGYNLP